MLSATCLDRGFMFPWQAWYMHWIQCVYVVKSVLWLLSLLLPLLFCPILSLIVIDTHFFCLLQELETDQILKQLKYIQMVCHSIGFITKCCCWGVSDPCLSFRDLHSWFHLSDSNFLLTLTILLYSETLSIYQFACKHRCFQRYLICVRKSKSTRWVCWTKRKHYEFPRISTTCPPP